MLLVKVFGVSDLQPYISSCGTAVGEIAAVGQDQFFLE